MRTSTSRSLHGRPTRPGRLVSGTINNADLGAALRARRHQLGLGQEAVAARAGLDHRVLSRLERGERACRVPELAALAAALNISPWALLKLAFGDGTDTAA